MVRYNDVLSLRLFLPRVCTLSNDKVEWVEIPFLASIFIYGQNLGKTTATAQ